jgi:hypothetical protein
MKTFFIIICSIILSSFSASQIRQKLCIDCKFYTKSFFSSSEFGKCKLFPREKDNDYFLVNGNNNNNNTEYNFCSIARKYDYMCGKEGKFYEKK